MSSTCALTQGYNLGCRNSLGGMTAAYIMEIGNLSGTTPLTLTAGVCSGITKATGKQFWKYNLVKQTGMFEETMNANEENGTVVVDQTVKFPLNQLTATVANELRLMAQNILIMVVVDRNGIGWLYGRDNGLVLKQQKSMSGTKMSDRNGYELEFVGFEKELAYQVDAATLLTLITPGT